jgi:hypothetical protein
VVASSGTNPSLKTTALMISTLRAALEEGLERVTRTAVMRLTGKVW